MGPSENLYNELLSGNPSQGTLFRVLSMMKKEGLLEMVMEECKRALETYPDDIKIRRLLAETYLAAGRISQAESEIKAVIAGINELMTCYRFQADLLISEGRNKEAIEALKLYMIHCPDDKEGYSLLESLLLREEVPDETMHAEVPVTAGVEEAAATADFPLDAETPDIATATLAEIYFKQGMTEKAIEIYQQIIEQTPDDNISRMRQNELKSMLEQSRLKEAREKERSIRNKKIMLILESWLEGVRKQSNPGLSIS